MQDYYQPRTSHKNDQRNWENDENQYKTGVMSERGNRNAQVDFLGRRVAPQENEFMPQRGAGGA